MCYGQFLYLSDYLLINIIITLHKKLGIKNILKMVIKINKCKIFNKHSEKKNNKRQLQNILFHFYNAQFQVKRNFSDISRTGNTFILLTIYRILSPVYVQH